MRTLIKLSAKLNRIEKLRLAGYSEWMEISRVGLMAEIGELNRKLLSK